MALANQEAIRLNHDYLAPVHIMLGILSMGSSVATLVLRNMDIDLEALRSDINKLVEPGAKQVNQTKMAQKEEARQVISYAIDEARKLGHKYVGTEHFLLGLFREGHNIPAQMLTQRGLKLDSLREEVLTVLRSSTYEDHAAPASGHDALEWVHQQELSKAFRSSRLWHRLIIAIDSANRLGHGEVGDEDLLMAILRDPESFVTQMLAEKGVDLDWVRDRVTRASAI
jgi:ATP-dependent Clp protease ATP-binding subunit ClpA